ncbi:MAG: HDOD domain-containing protein [Myxococcota bacterium]|nr:HDOD domain-containing protein [Myxococcales bacterium]
MSRSLTDIVREAIESGRARIPVFDANAVEIQRMISSGAFDIGELERVVARDPGLSGALLRVANSSFYGGLEKVLTIRDAVMRLGAKRCSELAAVVAQKKAYRVHDAKLQKMSQELWRHALGCALGSSWLAKRIEIPEIEAQAALAGLLHDVGKLLVLIVIDDLKRADARFQPTEDFIREAIRALHTEHGETLLRAWGLPDDYVRIVRHHHDDDFDESDLLLLVVRVVDQACNALGMGLDPCPDLVLANSAEAQALRIPELVLAELEVQLEDADELAR